jgi:hypothetical protein
LLGHEVVRTGRVVVCRDDAERLRFETRITALYLDTAHMRRVQHDDLRERTERYRARSS